MTSSPPGPLSDKVILRLAGLQVQLPHSERWGSASLKSETHALGQASETTHYL